jgi:hypothetical protein
MLLRIRWFLLGVAATLGGGAYIVHQLRRMREQLAPKNVARVGVTGVADLIDAAARRIHPDAD